jgi:hypothetical protein
LDNFAKHMLADNGANPKVVPSWPGNDYDSIFVFKIQHSNGRQSIAFSIDHENLNGLSAEYPKIPHSY